MKLIKVKPYFIVILHNEKEFLKFQRKIFRKGYKWLDGAYVWKLNSRFNYPIYLSNLPFSDDIDMNKRNEHNEFKNDIIFYIQYTDGLKVYDQKELTFLKRKEKLEKLNNFSIL